MNILTKSAAVVAMLAVSACSNTGGLFGGGTDPNGTPGGPIDESSLAYFQQTIGDTVLFEVDQSTLTPTALAILDQQAAWLNQNPGITILIEGHADEQGTREYNVALGAKRANAVSAYLVSQGVADSRISIISYGKERPLAVCSSESCWSQNRRAVTIVTNGPSV